MPIMECQYSGTTCGDKSLPSPVNQIELEQIDGSRRDWKQTPYTHTLFNTPLPPGQHVMKVLCRKLRICSKGTRPALTEAIATTKSPQDPHSFPWDSTEWRPHRHADKGGEAPRWKCCSFQDVSGCLLIQGIGWEELVVAVSHWS